MFPQKGLGFEDTTMRAWGLNHQTSWGQAAEVEPSPSSLHPPQRCQQALFLKRAHLLQEMAPGLDDGRRARPGEVPLVVELGGFPNPGGRAQRVSDCQAPKDGKISEGAQKTGPSSRSASSLYAMLVMYWGARGYSTNAKHCCEWRLTAKKDSTSGACLLLACKRGLSPFGL